MKKIDINNLLSALWLFILLNIIFRDIHQFTLKSHLEMLLTGYYNGTKITEELMLFGGFLVEVPIAMVLLSLMFTRNIGRPVTIVAAFTMAATLLFTLPSDMDDVFHLVMELSALAVILWKAWIWPEDKSSFARVSANRASGV